MLIISAIKAELKRGTGGIILLFGVIDNPENVDVGVRLQGVLDGVHV